MTRYLIGAAAVLLLSASPVLAADTMKPIRKVFFLCPITFPT